MRITMFRNVFLLLLIALTACSSMKTYSGFQDAQSVVTDQSYQLRVRTGNQAMDRIVYEFAYAEFGKYLPMVEHGATRTGTVDIVFRSTSENAYVGTTSAYATTTSYADGWYTGGGNVSATGRSSTVGTGITTGSAITWQNSTMIVILRASDGRRLWSADYKYKGGWEFSSFYVNTADEAARLCIERIGEQLERDLGNRRSLQKNDTLPKGSVSEHGICRTRKLGQTE